ncbi:hypothetical protein Pfo_025804 [Paulownia fortunei]|nr:hypothetical protein Pfo_025804 [Paulownia fortunei]
MHLFPARSGVATPRVRATGAAKPDSCAAVIVDMVIKGNKGKVVASSSFNWSCFINAKVKKKLHEVLYNRSITPKRGLQPTLGDSDLVVMIRAHWLQKSLRCKKVGVKSLICYDYQVPIMREAQPNPTGVGFLLVEAPSMLDAPPPPFIDDQVETSAPLPSPETAPPVVTFALINPDSDFYEELWDIHHDVYRLHWLLAMWTATRQHHTGA